MLVGCLIPATGRADPAYKAIFRDNGRPTWQHLFKLVGPPCDEVTREGKRLRVTSCPHNVAGSKVAMVWALAEVDAPAFTVKFDYTHHGASPPPQGDTVTALMILAGGDGTTDRPADVAEWDAQCCNGPSHPTMGYARHMRGLQLNFAYRFDRRGNDFMRLRALKGAADDYEQIGEVADVPIADGRAYRFTVVRDGADLSVTVRDNVTGMTRSLAVSHPYIGELGAGRIGIRQMAGRSSSVTGLKVSVPKG
jgi:hypothetical protein